MVRAYKCKGWAQRDTEAKTAGNSINRDKTASITFQVKGFLVYGTYENLIKKHRLLSDFLTSSTAYLTLKKTINKDQ